MKILNHHQIIQKIKRLAIQIVEQNYNESSIILAGINNNGYHFAALLQAQLKVINKVDTQLTRLRLNPASPLEHPITLEMPAAEVAGKVFIIVDDVANTGRTIFYAFKTVLNVLPKKVEVAVLVNREHKFFPIKVDYVGLSLATTLMEHIDVHIRDREVYEVHLND